MSTVAIYDLHASPFIKLVDVTNHDGVISSEVLVDSERNDPFNQTSEFLEL